MMDVPRVASDRATGPGSRIRTGAIDFGPANTVSPIPNEPVGGGS